MQLLGRLAGRGPGAGVARSTRETSELLLLSLLKNRGRSRFKRRRLGVMDFGDVGARNGGSAARWGLQAADGGEDPPDLTRGAGS